MPMDESVVDEPVGIAISYADADEDDSPEVTMFRKVGDGEAGEVGTY
ncbi:MAG: hypothetical protein GWO24_30275, partial [Akkermansiaceae bacterium]|nr:hypothetical protein [Akkermansiaceae bacterium]